MKRKEVLAQPLIGKNVSVVTSTNPTLRGIRGEVDDETTHLMFISGKKIQKSAVTLDVHGHIIDGKELVGTYTRIRKG